MYGSSRLHFLADAEVKAKQSIMTDGITQPRSRDRTGSSDFQEQTAAREPQKDQRLLALTTAAEGEDLVAYEGLI